MPPNVERGLQEPFSRMLVLTWFKQFPQDLILTNGASHLSIVLSTPMCNWAPVRFLMYEQSIEIDAFLWKTIKKNSLKIKFKHHLSEMYLLHEKAQPPSFHDAIRQPSFPLIYPRYWRKKMLYIKLWSR